MGSAPQRGLSLQCPRAEASRTSTEDPESHRTQSCSGTPEMSSCGFDEMNEQICHAAGTSGGRNVRYQPWRLSHTLASARRTCERSPLAEGSSPSPCASEWNKQLPSPGLRTTVTSLTPSTSMGPCGHAAGLSARYGMRVGAGDCLRHVLPGTSSSSMVRRPGACPVPS